MGMLMLASPVTFALVDDLRSAAIARLVSLGFVLDVPRPVDCCLLDTFDGRLNAAGLRLQAAEAEASIELALSGLDGVSVGATVPSLPRFATDLPIGPFRGRLAAMIGVRALLPTMSMRFVHTTAMLHDDAEKTVALVDLREQLHVDGRAVAQPRATIEVVRFTGYAKRAAAAVDALDSLGLPRLGADTVSAVAAAAGVDLAGYSDVPTVPLEPDMAALDGLRALLSNLAETVTANWQGTIDETDPEFLHDLRVAVRRTRTILSRAKKVLPAEVLDDAAQRFAWLGALTGRARDLDVYLIEWDDYVEPLGAQLIVALAPAYSVLEQRCRLAHADLVEGLCSNNAVELIAMWQTWLHRSSDDRGGPAAHRPLGDLVVKWILNAHTTLVERGRMIGPGSPPEQIHDLRKDAKKLRYLLECFGSLLADKPRKSFVRRLKAFQDNLGEYQDAQVHAEELAGIAEALHARQASTRTLLAIGQLIELLDQRSLAARTEFAERFGVYDSASTTRVLNAALAIEPR
jgi:CHAD domain-containing protein